MTRFFNSLSSSIFQIYFYITDIQIPFEFNNRTTFPKNEQQQIPLQLFGGLGLIRYSISKMQLIFQNTKDLKQVRQFIKSLGYVYDSIDKKQKEVYLFISGTYIAIVNDFMNVGVANYKVCFCKLKKNMYKLRNFNPGPQFEEKGIIFYIDSNLILKLLNTQVQPDITQMVMTFPHPGSQQEKQYEMRLSYEAQGLKGNVKLFTRLQHCKWPFQDGTITPACLQSSLMSKLLIFPPKFGKQIQYYKKYPQFWLCLTHDGLNIKRTDGSYVVSDQFYKNQEFGDLDFYNVKEALRGNVFLNINSKDFFHHLDLSNKQNRKAQANILIQQQFIQQESVIKKCYLCLTTITQKRQIHQFFQIQARATIDYSSAGREAQRLKLRLRDPKKEQNEEEERIVLNRFYGPQYEQTIRHDMIMRDGLVRPPQPKGEQTNTNFRKYKVEL